MYRSPEFMSSYRYVSVGNWQNPLMTYNIQVRQITIVYTIFVGHQKQFLPKRP